MLKILLIIPLLLDGIISNYVKTNSYFLPLLTVTTIFIIYPLYKKKEKNYFVLTILLGIIYDLLYTNLLLFNAILFFIIGILSKYIHKNFTKSVLKIIIYISIIIICYESITAILLFTYKVVPITISKIIRKISYSLLLNITYGEILYFIIKRKTTKY